MKHLDPLTQQATTLFAAKVEPGYHPVGLVLFGSRARGEHRPDSDADVAVLLHGSRNNCLQVSLGLSDLAYDILLETGININPIPLWVDEWANPRLHPNPALVKNIAREGVSL